MNSEITAHQETVIGNAVLYIELLKSGSHPCPGSVLECMESQEQVDIRYNLREWRKIQSRQICTSDKKSGLIPKVTISWKDFSPRFKNRIEHYGVLVKPKLGGYSVSCFPKALDWELEMIRKQKTKLYPSANYSRSTISADLRTSSVLKN
jgi:hypothetical protein